MIVTASTAPKYKSEFCGIATSMFFAQFDPRNQFVAINPEATGENVFKVSNRVNGQLPLSPGPVQHVKSQKLGKVSVYSGGGNIETVSARQPRPTPVDNLHTLRNLDPDSPNRRQRKLLDHLHPPFKKG
jgi:hypothetical protein